MEGSNQKELRFAGTARKDLRKFPPKVRGVMGHALFVAQSGGKHPDAKPLRSFGGAGVLEIVENFDKDTYRAVYTVRFKNVVWVLHAFQKKSKHGVQTPQHDLNLIRERLKEAERWHASE